MLDDWDAYWHYRLRVNKNNKITYILQSTSYIESCILRNSPPPPKNPLIEGGGFQAINKTSTKIHTGSKVLLIDFIFVPFQSLQAQFSSFTCFPKLQDNGNDIVCNVR